MLRWIQASRPHFPRLLLAVAVLAYALTFAHLTLTRYAAFEARALDMGNMHQAIWNTWQGRWFHLTNQPGTVNRLSLHVEPILLPISWLYWIHSGPETLLVLQAVVVALGAIPLFALARLRLGNEWLALAPALAFLLNPAIQAANWLEFHPVTLAPTFFMAAFYFLLRRQTAWYALFAVLAASCKEELALLVLMMGLYAAIFQRRYRLATLTVLFAAGWAYLAVFVIQTTFAAGNIHWGRYAYLGETPGQMLLTLFTRPDVVLAQLQAADALGYLGQLLFPVAFLSLLAPEILLLALPSLAINLLADFPPMHQVNELIYAAPIVPFVMMAATVGMARLGRLGQMLWRHLSGKDARGTTPPIAGQALGALLLLAFALTAQRLYGYLPGGGQYQLFTVTEHHRRAAAIIAQIPPEARVSAQDRLNPHVSGRETVYIFPRIDDADTIFLDVTGPAWPQHPSDLRTTVAELLAGDFGVAAADDGYLLLRKGAPDKTFPPSFYSAWRRPGYVGSGSWIDFGESLRLLDRQVRTDAHGELVVDLYWQALRPLDQDYQFYIGYADPEGNLVHESRFYPPVAALWYPTSMWDVDVPVQVSTLPWTLELDRFVLLVGVVRGKEWQAGDFLPVTGSASPVPLLAGGTLARLGGYEKLADGRWQPVTPPPMSPATVLQVRFGDAIVLEGATVPATRLAGGDVLDFTLYWRAEAPPAFDYSVFAHLVDGAGNKVAQLDWQPRDPAGLLPATAWPVGQPVVDAQHLALPVKLPPGEYRLMVGLYNWQDGQRLPARADGGAALVEGDAVAVATLQVH
ncbi:MAG: hypothetical protein KatS3mg050_0579 [Litorilinea sp.]|nr:MAG: hypothetical protein KatS3mg050_0579 [Litorilinea sp.]